MAAGGAAAGSLYDALSRHHLLRHRPGRIPGTAEHEYGDQDRTDQGHLHQDDQADQADEILEIEVARRDFEAKAVPGFSRDGGGRARMT